MFPRKTPHWLSLLIALTWLSGLTAAEKSKLPYPKLVVGIHIDQLESEYLHWFMDAFCEDGFKKLLREGSVFPQTAYQLATKDDAATVASMVCACPPRYHGIIAQRYYDRKQHNLASIVADANYLGNYTNERYSPLHVQTTNIADELKLATNNRAKVYSIGIQAESCIISAGHHADGVYWRDNQSGLWCSSTYYPAMPRWVENINDFQLRDQAFEKMVWQPKYALSKYQNMPHQKASLIFQYSLANIAGLTERVKLYKQSPLANEDLCRLAIELIGIEHLGQDEVPDLLNLHFQLAYPKNGNQAVNSIEIQDFYYRLDESIATLLQELNKKVGMENVLVYLVGTGESSFPVDEDAGSFYPDRCASLLNLYLGAKYGREAWIEGYSDTQIYLDRALIQAKGLDYGSISRDAALFLTEVEGVEQVFLAQDFNLQNHLDDYFQNSHYANRSGDLTLRLQQGRNIEWKDYPQYNRQLRYNKEHTLLVFYGHNTLCQTLYTEPVIFDLAPTVCHSLYIRPPTANKGRILPIFVRH